MIRNRSAARLAATLLICAAVPQLAAAAAADGATLFNEHCSACHSAGGVGTPGLAPPLNRPDFWKELGDDAPHYISAVITKGLSVPITVEGQRYMGLIMPPVSGVSDEDLATIATWVVSSLGETDRTVTADEIAATRDSDVSRDDIKGMRPKTE